jgi:hypothetical protein
LQNHGLVPVFNLQLPLLCFCSRPRLHRCRPFPELLADPAPLSSTPRGSLLARPPLVQLLLALPHPATLGRRCRGHHAAEGARWGTATAPSVCGWPRAYSLPLCCTTPLYKTSTEASLAHLPFLLPHERQAEHRAVRRNSSPPRPTPSQFQRPKAFSPPLLAPRPTLAELCPLLDRNWVNPVPPSPPEKPEPPPCQRPPSLHLRPKQVPKSHPHDSTMLVRTPSFYVHRPLTGNTGAPPRPPPFLVVDHAPPPFFVPTTHQCVHLLL